MVAGLPRLVVPDRADDSALGNPEDRPAEFFDAERRRRASDMVWRAGFREGTPRNGERPGLLVPIAFQSTVSTGRGPGPDATDEGGEGPVTGGFQLRREAGARARRAVAETLP